MKHHHRVAWSMYAKGWHSKTLDPWKEGFILRNASEPEWSVVQLVSTTRKTVAHFVISGVLWSDTEQGGPRLKMRSHICASSESSTFKCDQCHISLASRWESEETQKRPLQEYGKGLAARQKTFLVIHFAKVHVFTYSKLIQHSIHLSYILVQQSHNAN